ncbi:hypothetical protein [Conexibacter arvalis]|uniref:Uncharacterized protein n=1 Tax=Conexibacter arvalis TaxID=912552 RepID=A0A840I8J6_9ACTN|nr:hypothetical protein [Conexibacter arvalis]MBB4660428.1 hypothetical protein [Conexibacter arvalis]
MGERLPEPPAEHLLERANWLVREARAMCERLDLWGRLQNVGAPVVVGAAGLGVIDRRDLDITTTCVALNEKTIGRIARLGAHLVTHEHVRQVVIRDDTGRWNTDPRYPDGYYLGLEIMAPSEKLWAADLWFVDEPERQPDLEHLRRFAPLMSDESRATILALKRASRTHGTDDDTVPGYLICEAVTQGGVRSMTDLRDWMDRRGSSKTNGEGAHAP